jgi:predicted DNA-binding protein with PD1-like motif
MLDPDSSHFRSRPMRHRLLNDEHSERTFVVVLDPGDEPIAALTDFARRERLAGAHFTAIGAFRTVTVGFFDLATKTYSTVPLAEQVEVVSLAGNIAMSDGAPKVHAHVVVARADGSAHGGHLMEARVDPTLEIVLTESPRHLRRVSDPRTGLALLAP